MGSFKKAVNAYTYTENGALTFKDSGSNCLNLFGMIGGLRERSASEVISLFRKAFAEDPECALRILLWSRDIRGGIGEKRVYRLILRDMLDSNSINLDRFADITTEFGSWKDIFTICNDSEIAYIVNRELSKRSVDKDYHASLMEKYAYSIGGKDNKRAEKLANALGLTFKQYRKWLSKARAEIKIVEQKMCAKNWSEIQYEHVPSKAMLNYSNAFNRNDHGRFSKYMEDVKSGKKVVHTGTLYPYDIVRKVFTGNKDENLDVLWKNIKNFDCDENSIVVCDVSGSMNVNNYTPISVAVSLAIYFAERNKGKFKGQMITFSDRPTFFEINEGTIFDKVKQVKRADWGMNTNIQSTFKLLLDACQRDNVPVEEMPKNIIIVSDMEFDACAEGTNLDGIKKKYADAGYPMPQLVFWNVASHQNNLPVRFDTKGTALVSGCSPVIFEEISNGCKDLDPVKFMLEVINKPRYDVAIKLLN